MFCKMIQTCRENDCGVCAVANVLDVEWNTAAYLIFGPKWTNKLRFNTKTKQIVAALGDDFELIRVKRWQDIPDRSVVKVIPPECEGSGNWHWVVWRDGKIWDSMEFRLVGPKLYHCRLVSYLGSTS